MARTQATPYVGVDAAFEITPVVGGVATGSPITLKNSEWEISPTNAVAEGPNTTDGMVRAPGLNDYSGSVKGSTDVTSASTPIEVNVMPGSIFFFKAYRSKTATTFFSGYLIVGKDLKIGTGTGTLENWSFSFMKCYGPLTLPNGATW